MGAWIETDNPEGKDYIGLVAPYVGAWIETQDIVIIMACQFVVAPYVGAWIETGNVGAGGAVAAGSLPTWERGLKHKPLE